MSEEWYYQDAQRQVQGPYSLLHIQNWQREGHLPPGTLVKAGSGAFVDIAQCTGVLAGSTQGAGVPDPAYGEERGFKTYQDPKGDKFVWDEGRQEWLPYEQAMYMLGFDGTHADAPPASQAEEIEAKLQATAPLDELGHEMANAAEADERQKIKEAKRKGLSAPKKAKASSESAAPLPPAAAFTAAAAFAGARHGAAFKLGEQGLGYYACLIELASATKRKAGDEITEDERLRRNKKKTERRKLKQARTWKESKINTNVYIKGLPVGVTEAELFSYFSKVGQIRVDALSDKPKIRIYGDQDALVSFEMEESVQLAIELLDGAAFKEGTKLSVQRAEFKQKGTEYKAKELVKLTDEQKKRLELKRKEQQSKLSWNEGEDDGTGLKIIVLKQVFHPDDSRSAYNFFDDLHEEIEAKLGEFGALDKITIFENNPEGVVSVRFAEGAAAERAVAEMDHAKMAGREVRCEYYDGITDYRVKMEDQNKEAARVEAFDDFLNAESNPHKI